MRPVKCPTGKVGYPTRAEAHAAILRLAAVANGRHRERWAYACPACPDWHLTHVKPTRGRRRRLKARARRDGEG